MPPLIVRLPEIVEAAAIESVPLDRLKVVPLATVTLLTESEADELCVTVMPLMLIWALSNDVGTWWSLELAELTQLLAVSQSPPEPFVQTIVA